ncbi:MAG: hypothetical protein H6741_02265 [Alphaproteobacteria bacterium]|nr:hypothetical protein [Alphaproteobacteria bacterium]MCB9791528.1 hypothetical protein [Alphaproteobacteria bacterium]
MSTPESLSSVAALFTSWLPLASAEPLRAALTGGGLTDRTSSADVLLRGVGTWELKLQLRLFNLPVSLRLVLQRRLSLQERVQRAGAQYVNRMGPPEAFTPEEGEVRAVLRLYVQGYPAPASLIEGLPADGASSRTALDFLSLDQPVLYLSTYDTGEAGFEDPEMEVALPEHPGPRPLVRGLTLLGRVPDTGRLQAFPETLTLPLRWLLDGTNALPAAVELSVDKEKVTGLVRMQRAWTPLSSDALTVTLSEREAGFFVQRQAPRVQGDPEARQPPEQSTREASKPTRAQQVSLRTDVDLHIKPSAVGLPFPKEDTARMTLGALVAKDPQGPGRLEGWLRLRGGDWQEPFGLKGLTVRALYGQLDLAKKELRALRGDARFAGQEVDFAMQATARREDNLIALRLVSDTPVLGLGAAILGRTTNIPADGLYIEGMGARGGSPEDPVRPEDYNLYVTTGEPRLDGQTYPPGLRVQGTLHVWDLASAQVDLGVSWGQGPVILEGRGLALSVAGAGFSLDLGSLAKDLPFRIRIDEDLQLDLELDYDLRFAGIPLKGKAKLSDAGVSFGLPEGGSAVSDQLRVTSLKSEGEGLSTLVMGLELERRVRVPVPPGIHSGLQSLPGGGSIEASGTLSLELVGGTTLQEIGLREPRLTGRFDALGDHAKESIALDVHLNVGDVEGWARALDKALEAWAKQAIEGLVKDLFGNLPVVGPLLTEVFGLGADAVAKLIVAADGVGALPAMAGGGIRDALGQTGVAFSSVDAALADAADWARGEGVALGREAGTWMAHGVSNGVSAVTGVLSSWIADMHIDVGEVADLGKKIADSIGEGVGGLGDKAADFFSSLSAYRPTPPSDGSAYQVSSAGRVDDAHKALADVGVAMLFSKRKFGGRSLALPMGRFRLPDSGDQAMHRAARSALVPRGWAYRFFGDNGQVSPWYNRSSDDLGGWKSKATEVEFAPLGIVILYDDAGFHGGSIASMGGGTYSVSKRANSVLIPPGWTVYMTRDDGKVAKVTGSVNSLSDMIDDWNWNDRVVQVKVLQAPPRGPAPWRSGATQVAASGRTAPEDWQQGDGEFISVEVDLSGHRLTGDQVIVATLEGASSNNVAYGVHGVRAFDSNAPRGFSLRVGRKLDGSTEVQGQHGMTPALARQWGWRVHWFALGSQTPGARVGATNEALPYAEGTALEYSVRHDSAEADGQAAPVFLSLSTPGYKGQPEATLRDRLARAGQKLGFFGHKVGFSDESALREALARFDSLQRPLGAGASYAVSPTGFSAYVRDREGQPLTVEQARSWAWWLTWARPSFGIEGRMLDGKRYCAGRTARGEGWTQYGPSTLELRVDTRAARLAGELVYASAISGDSSHWETLGASSIYHPDETGFTVYVSFIDGRPLTPQMAKAWGWHVHWMASATERAPEPAPTPTPEPTPEPVLLDISRPEAELPDESQLVPGGAGQAAWGQTSPAQWEGTSDPATLRLRVDLSAHGFTETPRIFTSMGGGSSSYVAWGVNGIYEASPQGFTVYVGIERNGAAAVDGQPRVTPGLARQWGWRLNWVALTPDAADTAQGLTADWQDYGDGAGVRASVQAPAAPVDGQIAPVFASMYGNGRQNWLVGTNAAYSPTSEGFATYVRQLAGTTRVSDAQSWGWSMAWCRPRFGLAGRRFGSGALHVGQSAPGQGWQVYLPNALKLRVDTRAAGLQGAPVYISAISGSSSHWETVGASAVYEADATGFTVYVAFIDGRPLTPADAQRWGWCIHWMVGAAG